MRRLTTQLNIRSVRTANILQISMTKTSLLLSKFLEQIQTIRTVNAAMGIRRKLLAVSPQTVQIPADIALAHAQIQVPRRIICRSRGW